MAAQTKTQVKAIQTALNKKGAKLTVDGVMGKNTNAAIAKYGNGSSSSISKAATPVKNTAAKSTSQSSSYSGNSSIKPSVISKPSPNTTTTRPKNAVGSFFDTIAKGFKDAINSVGTKSQTGTALNATVNPTYVDAQGNTKSTQLNPAGYVAPTFLDKITSGTSIGKGKNMVTPTIRAKTPTPTIFSGAADNANSGALIPGQFGGDIATPAGQVRSGVNAPSLSTNSSTTTTTKNTIVNPDGSTSEITKTDTPQVQAPGITSNPAVGDNTNKNLKLLDNTLGKSDPFETSITKENNKEIAINSFTDSTANLFSNPADVYAEYQKNPTFKSAIDSFTQKYGGNIDQIVSKVKPVTNGITPAQDTSTYLASLKPSYASLEGERKIMNEEMALSQNWNKEQKELYLGKDGQGGILAQMKKEAQDRINAYNLAELKRETTLREKAQYMIEKNKADLDSYNADKDLEQINSKSSMTGMLAKLGALDTSSSAYSALTSIDEKYEKLKSDMRMKVTLANREIELNMQEEINNAEANRDEKILDLNSDLSKSEREINMEMMKLNYDTNKDILNIKSKWQDAIRVERNRYEAKAEAAQKDWTSNFFTTASGNNAADLFKSLPTEFRSEWLKNAPSWGAGGVGGKADLPSLMADYANYEKTKPVAEKNYTAANIPDDIMTSIQEDISAGVPDATTLIKLYPEVSSSYLTTLYNNSSQ